MLYSKRLMLNGVASHEDNFNPCLVFFNPWLIPFPKPVLPPLGTGFKSFPLRETRRVLPKLCTTSCTPQSLSHFCHRWLVVFIPVCSSHNIVVWLMVTSCSPKAGDQKHSFGSLWSQRNGNELLMRLNLFSTVSPCCNSLPAGFCFWNMYATAVTLKEHVC